MPHLNDARAEHLNLRVDKFRDYRSAMGKPAEINCSLCAAAAVVSHATGTFTTSGDVARAFPQTGALHYSLNGQDPFYQHSNTFARQPYKKANASDIDQVNKSQAAGILQFCRSRINGLNIAFEYDSQDLSNAKGEMRSLGSEYLFAVLLETHGHWNFAHNPLGGLEFIDYQSDHASYQGRVYGPDPMLGIRPGTTFHDGKTRVLAFFVPGYRPHRLP